MSRLSICCRNVMPVLLAAQLLSGCEGYYQARRELGLDPQDPPRPEVQLPPPGTISQASWAAQRTATLAKSDQSNTVPVGYKEPEKPAAAAAPAAATPMATAPATTQPSSRMASAPATAPAPRPAPAIPPSTSNPAALSVMPSPALPAGYKPSPSVVDQPGAAQEQQQIAAAAGAVPEPPMLSGSMKDSASAMAGGWKAHLASHRTESAAINEWQELLKANAALYGQFDPLVEWTDTPRGAFARLVLVGFAERKDADAACARLRSSTRYCASIKD